MRFGWAMLWLSAIPAYILRFDRTTALLWQNEHLPHLRAGLASFTGLLPFPLCDLLFAVLLTLVLYALLSRKTAFIPYTAAILSLSLSTTWLAPCTLSESAPPITAAQLQRLCTIISKEAAALHAQERPFDRQNIAEYAAQLCQSAAVPKPALSPALLKALGLAGWWSPLTSEAVVDMSMSELNLPFALCHELMHAHGIADEAQANFHAYQACMRGNAAFRYSGAMNALWHSMRMLKKADPHAWEQVCHAMSDPVRQDFARMNGFSQATSGLFSRLQDACTGLYLFLIGSDDYDAIAAWLAAEKFAQ